MHETLAWADLQDCGNAQAQLILLAIARNADWKTGTCEVSQSTLCQMAKCSPRTIRRYLSKMQEDRLITREERRGEDGSFLCDRVTLCGYSEWSSTIRKGGVVEAPKTIKPYEPAATTMAHGPAANLADGQSLKSLENSNPSSGQNQPSSGQQVAGTNDSIILDYIKLDCKNTKDENGSPKYDLKYLETVLLEAAGPCLDNEANCSGLLSLATPLMWLSQGADLHLDILPTLRAYAVKYRGRNFSSWNYFNKPIAACKRTREEGLQPPAQKSERSFRSSARNYKSKNELMEEALANLGKEEAKL